MSGTRWALSGVVVLHFVAVALGAIPTPAADKPIPPPRHPTDDAVAAVLTPDLDTAAAWLYQASSNIQAKAFPLPQLARGYLRSMGLGQQWTMFWDPPKNDEYVRMRYYVGGLHASSPQWRATELVFPGSRDDDVRLVKSLWLKDQDKAIFASLDRFINRGGGLNVRRPGVRQEDLPDDLVPLVRFFGERFAQRHLTADERLLRVEVWFGVSPIPPRGAKDPDRQPERLAALERYYAGLLEERLAGGQTPAYPSREIESDIAWFLEYFAEP